MVRNQLPAQVVKLLDFSFRFKRPEGLIAEPIECKYNGTLFIRSKFRWLNPLIWMEAELVDSCYVNCNYIKLFV